jgi:hypothetical protein
MRIARPGYRNIRANPHKPRFFSWFAARSAVASASIRLSAKTTQAGMTRKTIHFS